MIAQQRPDSPYKGLIPYSEADEPFFFGRERERKIISANLMSSRLTLLYGPSGVGKSSLLQAGVVSRMRELTQAAPPQSSYPSIEATGGAGQQVREDQATRQAATQLLIESLTEETDHPAPATVIVAYRSWSSDPTSGLLAAIQAEIAKGMGLPSPPAAPEQTLLATLNELTAHHELELFIILDQFEEYFLYRSKVDHEGRFAQDLARAVTQEDLPVNFLLSLREDWLAKLDIFKGLIPSLFDNYLRLEHLDRSAAAIAITEPVREYNARYGTAVKLQGHFTEVALDQLQELSEREGLVELGSGSASSELERGNSGRRIQTPFLQLVMMRLWQEAIAGDQRLKPEMLELPPPPDQRRASSEAKQPVSPPARERNRAAVIVQEHLDGVMNRLTEPEQEAAAQIFDHLVTPSGKRIVQEAGDLVILAGTSRADMERVLKKLTEKESSVLTRVAAPPNQSAQDQDAEDRYEVLHDVLGRAILEWRRGYLEKQERIAEAERHHKREHHHFVQWMMRVLTAAAIVAVGLALWALTQQKAALRSAAEAKVQTQLGRANLRKAVRQEGIAQNNESRARAAWKREQHERQLAERAAKFAQAARASALIFAAKEKAARARANELARLSQEDRAHALALARREQVAAREAKQAARQEQIARTAAERASQEAEGGKAELLAQQPGKELDALVLGMKAVGPSLRQRQDPPPQTVAGLSAAVAARLFSQTLTGHTRPVRAAAFSRDGRRIVSAGEDGTARIWDVGTGTVLTILHPDERSLWSAEFSPDGSSIITGGRSGIIRVWNAKTGEQIKAIHNPATRGKVNIWSAAFSPDGARIVSAESDGVARIWDLRTGQQVQIFRGHAVDGNTNVWSAAFSPTGERVVSAGGDGAARIWDTTTGQQVSRFIGHRLSGNENVWSAVFSPDGSQVLSAGGDSVARIWEATTGNQIRPLVVHARRVLSAQYSRDGMMIVTGSDGAGVSLWDARTGVEKGSPPGPLGPIRSAAFSPDGSRVLSACDDGTARLYTTVRDQSLITIASPACSEAPGEMSIRAAVYSPDGQQVITLSDVEGVVLWSAHTGRLIPSPRGFIGEVGQIAEFSANRKHLGTSTADDRSIHVWGLPSRQVVSTVGPHSPAFVAATFSPDGKRLFTADKDGRLQMWNATTGKLLASLMGGIETPDSLAVCPDGTRVAVVGRDSAVSVWEPARRSIVTLRGHTGKVWNAVFSRDGKQLATVCGDQTARLWDGRTGKPLAVLQGHLNAVTCAAFSPDGARLVTAGRDGTARIWNARARRLLAVLTGHKSQITSTSFSPDGRRVVTSGADATVRLWDARSGQPLAVLEGHNGSVLSGTFSPDGTNILTLGVDGTAKLFPASVELFLEMACRLLRRHSEFESVRQYCDRSAAERGMRGSDPRID